MRKEQVLRPVISGKAVVCCVHDREKRVVTTERQVSELGVRVGQIYNRAQHKLHLCACCENLFVDPSDIPRFCEICRRAPTHMQAGPLPEPKGVV